jgi:hypothetical protein
MVRAGWTERYVVLSKDFLHYFRRTDDKSEMFGEERDRIPVDTVERVLVRRGTEDEGAHLYIEVHTSRRGYPIVLTAKDDKVTLEWAQGIDFVSKIVKGVAPPEQGGPFNDLYTDSCGNSRSIVTPSPLVFTKFQRAQTSEAAGTASSSNVDTEVVLDATLRWGGKCTVTMLENETIKLMLSDGTVASFTIDDLPREINAVSTLHVEAMFPHSLEVSPRRSRARTHSSVVSGQDMSLLNSAVTMNCKFISSAEAAPINKCKGSTSQQKGAGGPGILHSSVCLLLWLYTASYFYTNVQVRGAQTQDYILMSALSVISMHFVHLWFAALFAPSSASSKEGVAKKREAVGNHTVSTFEVLLEKWVPPEGVDAIAGDLDRRRSSTSSGILQLPKRFLYAEKGDAVRGMERYKATLKFRREEKLDDILQAPQPNFYSIKECYPHWYRPSLSFSLSLPLGVCETEVLFPFSFSLFLFSFRNGDSSVGGAKGVAQKEVN